MLYQLNLREVTYALSEALDYVGIDDIMHGKRVSYIACEIGKKIGWRQSKLDQLMLMAMLHDCGVSSTGMHHAIVSHLDWEDSYVHCATGARLLHDVPFYRKFAEVIAFHHTHWEKFAPEAEEEMKLYANVIYLADRIDALRSQFGAHLGHEKETIVSLIGAHTPSMFAPQLSEAFTEIARSDTFWYYLDSFALPYYFKDWIDQGEIQSIHFDLLKKIALMFAGIINAKGPQHDQHTIKTAALARFIAQLYHLSLRDQELIELCALLNDLGKLRIPDTLLTKTAPLSDEEHIRLRRQGFDAQIILGQIKGFEKIAKIVAQYHETLYAKEKHFGHMQMEIPLEVRILSCAHAFESLLTVQESKIDERVEKEIMAHQLDAKIIPNIVNYLVTNTNQRLY